MQHRETVEEYLKRGGKITTYNPSPKWERSMFQQESNETDVIQTVPWKELYSDGTADDPQYWKKLNEKMDKILKKQKFLKENSTTEVTEVS